MNRTVVKYALWNNKGGVGKTFLSFVLSTEYAEINQDKIVVVIDMCPQANVSEILLGGNEHGSKKLADLIDKEATIGGYFKQRISSPHRKTGTEINFVNPADNPNLPDNLYLVAGDPLLELQVQTINNIAVQDLPPNSWANVHSWIIDIQDAVEARFPDKDIVFFIDCNPSFSSYTEQAILAATRLIIPCSPDSSSARAIRNVFRLVYGYRAPAEYERVSFYGKLKQYDRDPPDLHAAILNRSTIYGQRQPSKAFNAMRKLVKEELENIFSNTKPKGKQPPIHYIPDAHSIAIFCSSNGIPLYSVATEKQTTPDSFLPRPSRSRASKYKECIDQLVSEL